MEIEKMYENADILKRKLCTSEMSICTMLCETCSDYTYSYPPFTAEKQLEIVKMILFSTWWMNLKRLQFSEKFDEGLAQMISELWQDLTEEEKQQVKGILE